MGSARFDGAEASLFCYKEMSDNGRQAGQYQVVVQFVEVTQNGNWSEAFRARWVLSSLQSLGKRCGLAHALSRFSTHCIVTCPMFLISSVRIASSAAAFPFFRCFNEFAVL